MFEPEAPLRAGQRVRVTRPTATATCAFQSDFSPVPGPLAKLANWWHDTAQCRQGGAYACPASQRSDRRPYAGGQLAAVTASSPTSVWAAGAADGTSVLHWNGTSWTPETIPSGPDGPRIMTGISAVRGSATEVWGAAGTFVVHHPWPVTGLTVGALGTWPPRAQRAALDTEISQVGPLGEAGQVLTFGRGLGERALVAGLTTG